MNPNSEPSESDSRPIEALFEKLTGVKIVRATETEPGNRDEILALIAERRAARQARSDERGEQWVARAAEAYEKRGSRQECE